MQELEKHTSKNSGGTGFLWSSRGTDKNKAALEEARSQVEGLHRQVQYLQEQLNTLREENTGVGAGPSFRPASVLSCRAGFWVAAGRALRQQGRRSLSSPGAVSGVVSWSTAAGTRALLLSSWLEQLL